ncbi:DUF6134 family protein [Kriegella aquimaris]|uniref:DUF6134 family protein n=1 Tax=Kriegella aquimaris TaxID=192904 RepID=UPI00115F846B|nr:DUF6134 family protein [Kriegella aquimaris]
MLISPYNLILPLLIVNFIVFPYDAKRIDNTALYFDIVMNEKTIGNLKATETNKNSRQYFHSSTTVKTKIIRNITVNYNYEVSFANDLLKKSDVKITINDRPHAETSTEWRNNEYQMVKNGKEKEVFKRSIDYTTILLYFEEPVNISSCFSEQEGTFNTIIPLGNHSYKKINSKGKENIYYYKDGALEKATIDGGLANFQLIAK